MAVGGERELLAVDLGYPLWNCFRNRIRGWLHIPARVGILIIAQHARRTVRLLDRIVRIARIRLIPLDPLIAVGVVSIDRLRAVRGFSLLLQCTRKRCRSIGRILALPRGFGREIGFLADRLFSDRAYRRPRREDCLLLDYQSIHVRMPAQGTPAAERQCPAS